MKMNSLQNVISNPGKHGSRRRIREKSILTTFKWKVCVLNDIQLKWYLHHCVGLKLNFQVIYLFWCLARPVRCFWEVFAIHGTTFRYARLVEKIGALWSRSVHVNTKTRGQTLLNIHEILYPIRLYLHLSADFRTIFICKKNTRDMTNESKWTAVRLFLEILILQDNI